MIEALSNAQANELFNQEAILFGKSNGIPEYRIVELFGEWACAFIERNIQHTSYLTAGVDWNCWDDCSAECPIIRYLYHAGFLKVVSENNYRLALAGHRGSEAGRLVDTQWHRRRDGGLRGISATTDNEEAPE